MTTDIWNFVGRWNGPFGNTQFWSLNAAPTASQDAIISGGAATTVASGAQAASILLAPYANLYVINAATLSATGLTNFGNVEIGAFGGNGEVTQDPNGNNYTAGGESVTISGTFANAGSGFLTLGNSNLTASTSLTVGQLTNTGTINLWGNENLSALKQATLVVNSAAPTTLLGKTYIHGDSLIQYASGGIQTIGTGAELQIDGQQSRVSIGAGSTNSALTGLANNLGTFDLEGDWSTGPGGAVVATNTNLFNSGSLQLDTYNADGASQMTIGGTLTNTGAVVVGNSNLSASTTLTLNNLVNYGSINLWGNETLHTSEQATLKILAAAPSIWTGQIFIHGDSDVIFASGGVNSIAAGAEIQIDGQQSRYSIGAGTTNSALAALSTNYGIFDEEGDWSTGPGGATVVTNVDFTNYATFQLDVYNADGASSFTDNGLFTNDDNVQVGNNSLSANATLTVNSLMNNGAFYVDSQRTGGVGHAQAAVIVKSAAPSASLGSIRLAGDSLLDYASGAIHSISSGALIELDGDAASLAIASNGQNSALKTLSSNAGTLLLRGASGFGAGVTLTTTTGYANSGLTRIDANGSDGGDTVTFGGALNNSNELDIGNAQLAANTTVNAASLIDTGNLTLQGNAGGPTSASATLAIAGAASAGASGYERIAGNATLSFGAGVGYTSVAATAWLELDGALAGVNLGAAGAHNSGLASFARNNGAFVLRGNSYGQGGAAVTTGVALVNSGTLTVDAYGNDGGSELHVGGALTNYKTLNIGNGLLSASTLVTAASLANYGALTIQGSAGAGSVPQAALNISGASASTVSNSIRIGGNAQLSFGSGSGFTQIGKTGNLELDGAQASVAAGAGGPNSGVSHLSVNNGVLLVRGNSGFGQGGVTFATVGDYSNADLTQIDYFGNDGGSNLSFGGTIFNKATLSIGNINLAAATTVTAAKLVNSGALTLQGGYYATGPKATLAISGASPTLMAGSLRVGGTATLSFGSGGGLYTISQGGFVELDGAQANIAVGSDAPTPGSPISPATAASCCCEATAISVRAASRWRPLAISSTRGRLRLTFTMATAAAHSPLAARSTTRAR